MTPVHFARSVDLDAEALGHYSCEVVEFFIGFGDDADREGVVRTKLGMVGEGMVARTMCGGSEGKRECEARPMRRERRGDHSLEAEMVGILEEEVLTLEAGEVVDA